MHWIFSAFLGAFFAAFVSIFAKIGIKNIDTTLATTVRSVIMAVFLLVISLGLGKLNGELFLQIKSRDWLFIVLSGFAGAFSVFFWLWALKDGKVNAVSAIDSFSIVMVILFATLFLGESLTWKIALGSVFVTMGTYLIVIK